MARKRVPVPMPGYDPCPAARLETWLTHSLLNVINWIVMITFILASNRRRGHTKKSCEQTCETVSWMVVYICTRKARTFKFVRWKKREPGFTRFLLVRYTYLLKALFISFVVVGKSVCKVTSINGSLVYFRSRDKTEVRDTLHPLPLRRVM